MKNASPPIGRPPSPEARFRPQIDSAIAAGVAPEAMTLRLTWNDANLIVRDPAVAVDEIRFESGAMYFLGVRVEKGGLAVSVLDGCAPVAEPPASDPTHPAP